MKPASTPVKARLWCVEKDAWSLDFQFNPEAGSLQLTRAVDWNASSEFPDAWGGPIEFDAPQADRLSFRVMFDETTLGPPDPADALGFQKALMKAAAALLAPSENSKDVLGKIQQLHRLTMPITPVGSGKTTHNTRPPVCAFVWDRFEFMGALISITTDFALVDEDGAVRRAMCEIEMMGHAFSGTTTLETFLAGVYKAPAGTKAGARSGASRDDILKLLR